MSKTTKDNTIFAGALMMMFFGMLVVAVTLTPEEYRKLIKSMTEKTKSNKALDQMTIKELEALKQEYVDEENYEMAAEMKKLIDYRVNNNLK